jgi:hypothetical protein
MACNGDSLGGCAARGGCVGEITSGLVDGAILEMDLMRAVIIWRWDGRGSIAVEWMNAVAYLDDARRKRCSQH